MTFGGNPRPQHLDHGEVELDGRQPRDARRQPQRQRAGSGPDFDEAIVRLRVDGRDELVGPRGFEKVLTVPFLGAHVSYTSSSDSPRQYFSSISSISSSLMPK